MAVTPDATALRGQAANLQYAWNGVLAGGSRGSGYARELDQLALYDVQPDATKLATFLRTRAGPVDPADQQYERTFSQLVGQWHQVATLAHSITTTAHKFNSRTRTQKAIDAFDTQLGQSVTTTRFHKSSVSHGASRAF